MGQDSNLCFQITIYSICSLPSVPFEAINDLSRKFYIQKGHYWSQKYIEIIGAIIQLLIGYILIFKADLGIIGAGSSISISQFIQFLINQWTLSSMERNDNFEISIFDISFTIVLLGNYLKKAFPSVLKQIFEHGFFIFLLMNASDVGGTSNQNNMAIFFIYQGIFYSMGLGLQSSSSQFIGYYLGKRKVSLAKKYYNFFLRKTLFISIIIVSFYVLALTLKQILWYEFPVFDHIQFDIIFILVAIALIWSNMLQGPVRAFGKLMPIFWITLQCGMFAIVPMNILIS